MLTKAFNCPNCQKPFDCVEGGPRAPFYSYEDKSNRCHTCKPRLVLWPQRGLMDFLNQQAFTKVDDGYEYTLPINEPICFGCEKTIKIFDGESPFFAKCRHYICKNCSQTANSGVKYHCTKCNSTNQLSKFTPDVGLTAFGRDTRTRQIKEAGLLKALKEQLNAREEANKILQAENDRLAAKLEKKEQENSAGARFNCSDCGSVQPVESLFKCEDCKTTNCGACSFISHRDHWVEKLIGIELDRLAKKNDQKYTETIEGLQGNLKYVQNNVNEAVEKVLIAGKDRLAKIKECEKYAEAEDIVAKIDKAADDFEKHCEVYIPVARQLASRLEELGEELMKDTNNNTTVQ